MRKILILIVFFFISCVKEKELPNEDQILNKVSEMSTLGTVEYNLTKIIQVDDKQWYSIGPRKILLECKAYVKAGIDFREIKIVEINDSLKSIKVEIPDAKILIVNIPPNDIRVINTHVGLLRANFTHEELDEIQKQAEEDINNKIQDLNILFDAKKNGKLFLQNFLRNLGFQRITIIDNNYIIPTISNYDTQTN
jgi:hypothetical protein